MGGHGGLNILPQKKWNVYNYDNRDIVQKDKKQHAEKTRKKYQTQRKHTIQKKIDVLKGEDSIIQRNQQNLKQFYKRDSILNNEFKRLAQENQHVNLFEHQQKIIQNREVLQYQKMKQAQWLKDKDMDYSSKFLGTYNDDGKIPWYAKSKGLIRNNNDVKVQKKLSKQRYDMQDLTDQVRLQKLQSRKQKYFGGNESNRIQQIRQNGSVFKTIIKQQSDVKVKREFNDERQRSRHKKYEFIKQRQNTNNENQRPQQNPQRNQENISSNQNNRQISLKNKDILTQKNQLPKEANNHQRNNQKQSKNNIKQIQDSKNDQLQLLRLKRLKRQQKQRKKAEQLRKKLQQSINRT